MNAPLTPAGTVGRYAPLPDMPALQAACHARLEALSPQAAVQVTAVDGLLLRAPMDTPLKNSFRTLTERFALMVRVRDADGQQGWGEVWCNYPPHGAQARKALLDDVVAPMLLARPADTPPGHLRALESAARVPALVSGDVGSFAQVLAGVDQALWDLAARRLGMPLWQLLRRCAGVEAPDPGLPRVRAYASGLAGVTAPGLATANAEAGHRAFKLKVGFGAREDEAVCEALRAAIGEQAPLMLDANQRWDLARAREAAGALARWRPLWLEEPMPADTPWADWQALAAGGGIALAAGENLRDRPGFAAAWASRSLYALQPDPGKWGGFSGVLPLAAAVARAAAAGEQAPMFCPHWLGGGVGLVVAQHLAAVVPAGHAWLEVDANPNSLRTEFLPEGWGVEEGEATLPAGAGLGFEPDETALRRFTAE